MNELIWMSVALLVACIGWYKDFRDAQRYRYLRKQHWSNEPGSLVVTYTDCVKLGSSCPSGSHLDRVIDIKE